MRIAPPFGYREVVPFLKTQKVRLLQALGIQAGENLFYAQGAWAGNVYVPAYARRHPFCMATINVDRVEPKERLICVEKAFIDEERGREATLAKGAAPAMHLTGMHRVSEKSLENLNAAQLKNLMRKGVLARLYMHLLSLENFARLLERKAARAKR